MRIKTPEETSYGGIILPKTDIKKPILDYIIRNKNSIDFSYEFLYGKNTKPVFLIGSEAEEKIPLLRIPVVVSTNGIDYVVSNMTGSLRAEIVDNSIMKSKRSDYVDFEVVRNMMIYYTLSNQDIENIATISAQIATLWITKNIKNFLRVDTSVEFDIEGALFIYFLRQYLSNPTNDEIKTKMSSYLSINWRNASEYIDGVLEKLKDTPLDMGAYIRALVDSHPTVSKIDTTTINSFISTQWYSGSDSSNIQIYIATENLHTMCAIIYHAMETSTGKKTTLSRTINDYKRSLRTDDLIYALKQMIKNKTV